MAGDSVLPQEMVICPRARDWPSCQYFLSVLGIVCYCVASITLIVCYCVVQSIGLLSRAQEVGGGEC